MDLAERLEALSARNAEPLPAEERDLSDEDAKAEFLSALEEGKTIPEAARRAGRTATWFRNRRKRGGRNYDPGFSDLFDDIVGEEGPWREAICLRMFTAMVQAGEKGNVRAMEKVLATYSREFGWMKPAVMHGTLNIVQVKQYLTSVPDSLLDQMIEAAQAEQKALPPVIDA